MITNFTTIVQSLSRMRILILFMLLIILTSVIYNFFISYGNYLIDHSLTFSSLKGELLHILGYRKYELYLNGLLTFLKVFIFLIFMYLIYRWEKYRASKAHLEQIIKDTSNLATGNFTRTITGHYDQNLGELVKNINNIVARLQSALEEERHVEHTKNELITNVSHDLRTPLTSIVGYLRLIEQDQYRDEVALRHYTGIAFEKTLRLEQLINELFEYTRMQDSRFVLNKEKVSIAEIIVQIIIQNRMHFREKQIICREFITKKDTFTYGDGERLARVFNNLIINALNYGQSGKFIDIYVDVDDEFIIIKVTNYGNPISSIDLPHLFERFYRAEQSRSADTGGSGLGLAIAKSIVTLHEGTIDVESNREKTSFIVKLKSVSER